MSGDATDTVLVRWCVPTVWVGPLGTDPQVRDVGDEDLMPLGTARGYASCRMLDVLDEDVLIRRMGRPGRAERFGYDTRG